MAHRLKGIGLILLFIAFVFGAFFRFTEDASAQGGMSKATAKLLVTDLIEAGFAPQIRESGGVYFVTIAVNPTTSPTAAQVNTFATNRGVTAKVLSVQFE